MTSTCSQSATSATAAASSASRAKSAFRMLGAIWTAILPSLDVARGHARVASRGVSDSPGRVPRVNPDTPDALLARVRKLLVKAEADGVTQAEAEALTAKAAELMAKAGLGRALLRA